MPPEIEGRQRVTYKQKQQIRLIKDALQSNLEKLFREAWGEPDRPSATQWRAKDDNALAMTVRGEKAGLWKNFKTDAGGDSLDFIAVHFMGLCNAKDDFKAVILEAARIANVSLGEDQHHRRKPTWHKIKASQVGVAEAISKRELVAKLALAARPVAGTAVEKYLQSRGIKKVPPCFEYLPPVPHVKISNSKHASLIVWGTDTNGERRGGQRIILDPDGIPADVDVRKPSFGRISGFPAKLPAQVSGGPLIVAEGPETAASIWMATGFETWAVFGVSSFRKAPIPADRQVILAPDQDAADSSAGKQFAKICHQHAQAGSDIWIARAPEPEGSKRDLNDTLRSSGVEAVRAAIAGAQRYTLRDARGRFTGGGVVSLNVASCAPEFMNADDARSGIRQVTAEFIKQAVEWDDDSDQPAPVLVIKATAGAGKSSIAREVLANSNLSSLNGDVVFYTPTLALSEEAARHSATLGAGDHVTRGRSAWQSGTMQSMCQRPELAEQVASAGLQIKPTICARRNQKGKMIMCPHASGCAYLRQWNTLKPSNELRFEASQYLALHGDGSERPVGLRVIDETIWSLFVRKADIPLDAWTRPRLVGKFYNIDQGVEATQLAERVDGAALAVLEMLQAGKSPLRVKFSAEEFKAFSGAESPPDIQGAGPDLDTAKLMKKIEMYKDGADPHAGGRAALWSVLADCRERGLDVTERVRIVRGVSAPKGSEPRDVIRVNWFAEPPRNVPLLLLDADADDRITERMYPGARIARFDLEPNAEVIQLTDVTFSKKALRSSGLRRNVAALVRTEVYRDMMNGGRGTLAIASREVVKLMFEDAGHDFSEMENRAISKLMIETILHGARWLWFGPTSLGRNDWKNYGTAVVIGREEWPIDELQDCGRAIFGDTSKGKQLCFLERNKRDVIQAPEVQLPITMRDGSAKATRGRSHPDACIRAIQRQTRECAMRQAIERLRLVIAGQRKRIVICSKIPAPGLPVDQLVTCAELLPTRFEAAKAEAALTNGGVLRLSASGLAQDAPLTFKSENEAKMWLKRDGSEQIKQGRTPNSTTITGTTLLKSSQVYLRRQGQRGRAVPALILLSGNPRAIAEKVLGALSAFLLDGPSSWPQIKPQEANLATPPKPLDRFIAPRPGVTKEGKTRRVG